MEHHPRETIITTSDAVQLWTASAGNGRLTVFISNGGPGCCDYLAPLADLLAADDRRVVRWEQRGIGRSGGSADGPFTLGQCVADMETIRDHFGCEQWVVAGHSWGADLSLIYALTRPERCAGILCVAGGHLNNDREWHVDYERATKEGRETQLEFSYPPNKSANHQLNAVYKLFVQCPTLFHQVATLEVPALFLYGAMDIRPSWAVEQVATLMPQARYIVLHEADHYVYLTHPSEVRAYSNEFLDFLSQIV
ncbi:MAG: alpha/beta fold hydrolase [Thermomicrobiales bacterium]